MHYLHYRSVTIKQIRKKLETECKTQFKKEKKSEVNCLIQILYSRITTDKENKQSISVNDRNVNEGSDLDNDGEEIMIKKSSSKKKRNNWRYKS